MMNQSASATRRPAGSTATPGCCPIFNAPFFVNAFSPQAPLIPPPPPTAQQCFLSPQATQLQIPSQNQHQQQQPPQNVLAQQPVSQMQQQEQQPSAVHTAGGQQQAQQSQRRHADRSSGAYIPAPASFSLQQLIASQHSTSNCMALAAALASAAHFQQLQQAQQQQQQQQQHQTPINQATNNTNTTAANPPVPPTNGTTTSTNTNQVPILNFNGYSAAQPFLNLPAPPPVTAPLNLNNNIYQHHPDSVNQVTNHQPNSEPVAQMQGHHHQQQQQQQPPPPSQHHQQQQQQPQQQPPPPPHQQPQTIPPIPFYSFPQMEQALALLTNPQVANNIFSHVFNLYLRGGLTSEPHHQHHHHHAPHHFHPHLHGSHHHHRFLDHGPNGQGNGQDVTMPLDSLAISESKPRGLNRAEIDSLTPYIQMNEKDSRTCVICLSKFELKSKIRPLPCNHAFHAKCVDKWLRANRTCPICRRDALKTYGAKIKRI